MRVYVCRHAKAEPGEPDELRPLTPEGARQARKLGEALASEAEPPRRVVSSPLVRARQTAEAIAFATGAPLSIDERLAPGATADDVRAIAAEGSGALATVGHQPDCSEIASALTGSDPGFKTGGMLAVELAP